MGVTMPRGLLKLSLTDNISGEYSLKSSFPPVLNYPGRTSSAHIKRSKRNITFVSDHHLDL